MTPLLTVVDIFQARFHHRSCRLGTASPRFASYRYTGQRTDRSAVPSSRNLANRPHYGGDDSRPGNTFRRRGNRRAISDGDSWVVEEYILAAGRASSASLPRRQAK